VVPRSIVSAQRCAVVVHGRQHRDRLATHVDAGEHPGALADAGQALGQDRRIQVVEVQVDVVLFGPLPAPFADLDSHRA
jgi:hypothetical protein